MIHCYQFDGLNIVLDCHSGSIHMVDPVAYDMIRWYETEPAEDVISKAVSEHGITREEAEECLADNFSYAVIYGEKGAEGNGYPNPEIIEAISKYLIGE